MLWKRLALDNIGPSGSIEVGAVVDIVMYFVPDQVFSHKSQNN